jgi:DNA replication and repair protein RecF
VRLRSISGHCFRNLAPFTVAPHEQFTVICGQNGQGKTNLLESIYYVLCLKSLHGGRLRELIRHGEERAEVSASLEREGVEDRLRISIESGARTVWLNEKAKPSLERYFQGTAVVAFTPADLGVVRGKPDLRRRYLDRAVFNRWPEYLGECREYLYFLKARNRLLREHANPVLRQSFEGPLVERGARMLRRRREWIAEIRTTLEPAFEAIARIEARLELKYVGGTEGDEAENREWLAGQLRDSLEVDLERGFTSVGPHADDLRFEIGGHSARAYASQGQVRALVLALKVAEIENLKLQLGFAPLLLLDDVSSELDAERNRALMDYLGATTSQVLMTTTAPDEWLPTLAARHRIWRVSGGSIDTEATETTV